MLLGKRRNYYIKKNFQARFILRFVALATVWAAITALVFAYLAGKKLDDLRYSSHIDITSVNDVLMPITIEAHILSLLIFICLLAYTIRTLWQKLSFPLADIKKGLEKISRGDLSYDISLRGNDEFQDMAADLDSMRLRLREKIVAIKQQQQVLAARAAELNRSIEEGNPSLPYAASLQSAVEKVKERVSAFHYPEQ